MRGISGSKKTFSPGSIASRIPHAAARSKRSARFVSKKWKCEVTPTGTSPSLTTAARGPARATPAPASPVRGRSGGAERVVQHEQPAAVGEQRLDLDPAHEAGHAVEHVGGPERAVPGGLRLRVGAPVARGLAHLVGDQGGGLGLVEPQSAGAPLARQLGGEEQQQAVLLAREEAHGRGSLSRRAARAGRLRAMATLERIPLGQLEAVVLGAGDLRATFVPLAGMIGCSLTHRGDELLGQRGGLDAWRGTGKSFGLPLLHPWANRLRDRRYAVAGRAVEIDLEHGVVRSDAHGLPIHGALAAAADWDVTAPDADADAAWLSAVLDYGRRDDRLAVFPFPHRVALDLRMEDDVLTVATTVEATAGTGAARVRLASVAHAAGRAARGVGARAARARGHRARRARAADRRARAGAGGARAARRPRARRPRPRGGGRALRARGRRPRDRGRVGRRVPLRAGLRARRSSTSPAWSR